MSPPYAGAAREKSMSSTPFSFELYPPRNEAARLRLPQTIDALAKTRPEFMSVTYGAGGSSHGSSIDVLRYILEHTGVEPMAHLTCIGSSHAEANRLIREFLDIGVRSFLALRGDPPIGVSPDAPTGDLRTAAELVQLIHRVQAERVPYREVSVPGLPRASQLRDERDFITIAIAAFPNGHPRSRSIGQDIDTLLAKQAAGANLAITQLFFHAEDYFSLVERARDAGVTFPILPGIMPVTSPARLRRMLELSGEDLPSELAIALEVEPTEAGQRRIGVDHAARLATELIDGGAPGIHLYTFNQHRTVLEVLQRCGLIDLDPSTSHEKESV